MNLLRFFSFARAARPQTAPAARERLQILLTHERSSGSQPDLVAILRASNVGAPVTLNNPASAPARAYNEAAKRLSGEDISMTVPSKPNLLTKLFGRRAA